MNDPTTTLPPLRAADPQRSTPLPPPPPPADAPIPTFAPPGLATGPAVPLTPPTPHATEPAAPIAHAPVSDAPLSAPAAPADIVAPTLLAPIAATPASVPMHAPVELPEPVPAPAPVAAPTPAPIETTPSAVATATVTPAPAPETPTTQPVEPPPVEPSPREAKRTARAEARAAKAEEAAAGKAAKEEAAAAKKAAKAATKQDRKAPKKPTKRAARQTSKTAPIALVVVLLAAAMAAAWFFLIRNDAGATTDPVADAPVVVTYSLADALADAQAAQAMQFDVVAEIDGVASTITAQVDRSSRLMSVTTSSSGLTAAGAELGLPEWINVIVDSADRRAYIDSNALAAINPNIDADWVRIDLDDPAVSDAFDVRPITINPLDVADVLTETGATDLGSETIDGERLQRFQVPVDASLILPNAVPATTIALDVWISADSRIRRVGYSDGSLSFDLTIIVFDRSLAIVAPQLTDTTDLGDIVPGG